MNLSRIAAFVRAIFRPCANTTSFQGDIALVPPGITPDNVGMWGLFGLINNLSLLDGDITPLVSNAVTITLTAAQMTANILDHSGAPAGGVAVTTPTAAQIIAALPNTIPATGCNFPFFYMNDTLGQTVTLTAGTGVSIVGTATIASAVNRMYMMIVNVNAGTVTLFNMGAMSL